MGESPNSSPKRKSCSYPTRMIIEALEKSHGLIHLAARIIGCDPDTIRKRARKDDKIRAAIENQRELSLDLAEFKLLAGIDKGEAWAICFFLKTLGRPRGYVERVEHSGEGGGPVVLKVVYETKSDVNEEALA